MLRNLLILFLLLTACCGSPQTPDEVVPPSPVIDDPRSVLISKECPDGSAWYGTGYALDFETVATANHVIMCSKNKTFGPYDIEPVKLKLNGTDITGLERVGSDEIDMAFINYTSDVEPVLIGSVAPSDRVCIFPAVPTRGRVCGIVFENEPGYAGVVMMINVVGGNSGSVIFNEKNEAVGVITSRDLVFSYGTSFETIGL